MALSPEDVIKKSFTSPHLRRGYDESQVDDFLDEVVVELRRLNAEHAALESDLQECRAGQGASSGDGSFVPADGATDTRDELGAESEDLARVRRERDELVAEMDSLSQRIDVARAEAELAESDAADHDEPGEARNIVDGDDASSAELEAAHAEIEALRAEVEQARGDADPVAPGAASGAAEDPTSIISLAQRLHDQHVAEGESTRARLVGEADEYKERLEGEANARSAELIDTGQRTHDDLVSTGQQTHDDLVSTGQQTHDELVTSGQQQHDTMIAEGQQERDRLIDEAQTTHERLLAQGQESHDTLVREGEQTRDQLVNEAEQRRTNILTDLSDEESRIKGSIEGLRTRESESRDRMRAMLTEQLTILGDDKE